MYPPHRVTGENLWNKMLILKNIQNKQPYFYFRRRVGMLVSGRALAQLVESPLRMLGYTPSIE